MITFTKGTTFCNLLRNEGEKIKTKNHFFKSDFKIICY